MSLNYSLIEKEGFHKDHWTIRVDEGLCEGLTYQYDAVKIIPQENPEDGAVLEFNTITVDNPNNVDLTNPEVKDTLGDILVDIIKEHIDYEDGTSNPESPAE